MPIPKEVNINVLMDEQEFQVYVSFDSVKTLKTFEDFDAAWDYAQALAEQYTPKLRLDFWVTETTGVDYDEFMKAVDHIRTGRLYA